MARPEPDAGVRTAYVFSKPHECEEMTAGQVGGLLRGNFSFLLNEGASIGLDVACMLTHCNAAPDMECPARRADHFRICALGSAACTLLHSRLGKLASNMLAPLQVLPRRAHSWEAGSGDWVTLDDFARVAHSDPYCALLCCESWQVSIGAPPKRTDRLCVSTGCCVPRAPACREPGGR